MATAAILAVLISTSGLMAGPPQRAVIRYDPQAPFQALPDRDTQRGEAELNALYQVQDESNPVRRERLISDFLQDYPASEFTHLILQARWQTRLDREEDPQEIIEAALDGLAAYQYFMDSKLGFIDDPSSLRQYPTAEYRFASQELRYHQSLVAAYSELDQIAGIAEHTEQGIEAADEAERWYGQLGDEAEDVVEMEEDAFREQILQSRMFLLDNLRRAYERDGNVAAGIETSERMLEVLPDDMELLLSTSQAMVQTVPDDPTERQAQMERARTYAEHAADGVDLFLLRSGLGEEQQAAVLAQLYSTMGMADAQLGDWRTAIAAYQAAIDADPMRPDFHYMLGFAGANAQDIDIALPAFARAHFLAPQLSEVRAGLEQLYQAKNGTLDGLDEYVQTQGETLGN